MEKDLISVVVPIYNIDQYVGVCIESIIKQKYKNIEIILVDDGSTDRSAAICDLYASKDERIVVIHKENGGLVSARKAGVNIAKGAYMGFVDGDDWIEPDFYEKLYDSMIKSRADVVCAGYSRDLFSTQIRLCNNVLDGIYEGDLLEDLFKEMLSYENSFSVGITTYVWNKLFRGDLLKVVQKDVDERIDIGEDAAVTYPALLNASRIYVCDNCSYHYRQREGSMLKVHASFDEERLKLGYLYEYLKNVFCSNKRSDILLPQLTNYILSYCIIRSGGIVKGIDLFGTDIYGKRVVIIQSGTIGQLMYERLRTYCNVLGLYDSDYWEYRRCCINVDPIERINSNSFDYAMIAKIDEHGIETTYNELKELGIPDNKILKIQHDTIDKEYALNQYLINK